MMWKTFIFLAITSVVLAGRIKKDQANYKFYIKHDYDYLHHKHEHHEHEKKQEHEERQKEEPKDEGVNESQQEGEQQENVANESEQEEQEQNGGEQEGGGNNEENGESQEGESNTETQEQESHEKDGFSAYEILYKVKDPHTHDMKGLHEKKYGDEIKGIYWLLQPDGYKRTVEYHADKHSGFHAKVDFSKYEEHHGGEENEEGEDKKHVAKSEYYVSTQHGLRKPTPIKEEHQEQENQEESVYRPIYVV